ncbi:MAG: hypothetical protein WC619_05680 [Patescibacteria group bacterium]
MPNENNQEEIKVENTTASTTPEIQTENQPVATTTPSSAEATADPPVGEASKPAEIIETPTPEPIPTPPTPESSPSPIKNLLLKAKEMIQFRKGAKLEKIMVLARTKAAAGAGQGKITNDDIQKLLYVSDATATRYLNQLTKEGRLKLTSRRGGAFYQLP